MYREPFANSQTNENMAARIQQKLADKAESISAEGPDLSDADFAASLLEIATLNRMAESHDLDKQNQ